MHIISRSLIPHSSQFDLLSKFIPNKLILQAAKDIVTSSINYLLYSLSYDKQYEVYYVNYLLYRLSYDKQYEVYYVNSTSSRLGKEVVTDERIALYNQQYASFNDNTDVEVNLLPLYTSIEYTTDMSDSDRLAKVEHVKASLRKVRDTYTTLHKVILHRNLNVANGHLCSCNCKNYMKSMVCSHILSILEINKLYDASNLIRIISKHKKAGKPVKPNCYNF